MLVLLSCGDRSAGSDAWRRFPAVPSPRFGPRQIRAESSMVRRYNGSTGAAPFDSLRVADIGDVNVNLYSLPDSCRLIRESYREIVASGCVPLTLGKEPVSLSCRCVLALSHSLCSSSHHSPQARQKASDESVPAWAVVLYRG